MKIKIAIFVFLLLVGANNIFAQEDTFSLKAIEIYEIHKKLQPIQWYKTHVKIWKSYVDEFSQNPSVWFNFYKANRYKNYTDISKKINRTEQEKLDDIVKQMERNVPNSFEYNFVRYWNSTDKQSNFQYLQRAYEIDSKRAETYKYFISYYELVEKLSKKKEFCEKWLSSGDIPEEIYDYNYNVLMSLDKNAIIITNGVYDTYPIWILQYTKKIRPDVKVIFLDLFDKRSYRRRILKELDLKNAKVSYDNRAFYFKSLLENNKDKHIYFGFTVTPSILNYLKPNLYITGLVFEYSNVDFDNFSKLKQNWEEKIKTDYLFNTKHSKVYFENKTTIDKLNVNYILPLYLLFEYYRENNNNKKINNIINTALIICKLSGNINIFKKYFQKSYDF